MCLLFSRFNFVASKPQNLEWFLINFYCIFVICQLFIICVALIIFNILFSFGLIHLRQNNCKPNIFKLKAKNIFIWNHYQKNINSLSQTNNNAKQHWMLLIFRWKIFNFSIIKYICNNIVVIKPLSYYCFVWQEDKLVRDLI